MDGDFARLIDQADLAGGLICFYNRDPEEADANPKNLLIERSSVGSCG